MARTSALPPSEPRGSAPALTLAGLAALLASGCCVAPLLLALAGVSGAWIGQLRLLAPYSPWLMGLSFLALASAGWRLYRRSAADAACAIDDAACRHANVAGRRWFWIVVALASVPVVVPLVAPLFY